MRSPIWCFVLSHLSKLAAISLSILVWFAATLLLAHRLEGASPEEASYLINMSNGDGGSCTFIHPYLAVTNWHVAGRVGSRGTLKHQFGALVSGQCVVSDENADIALILVQQPQPFVPLAAQGPQRGEPLTLCGYHAPQRILKAGTGTLQGGYSALGRGVPTNIINVVSISGDSGGGIFNAKGELCAVNWGRDNSGSSLSTSVEYLKAVGERWATSTLPQERWQEVQCFGGRCQPYGGGQQQQPYGGGYGVQPKLPVTQPPQQLQPVPPPLAPILPKPAPATPVCEPIDYAKLADVLAKDERFRGPAGKDGKDGGACDEEKIAAAVLAKIDYAKIASMVKVNTPAPPAVNSEKHIVIVADQKASYWMRLSGEIATAQQSYLGIEVAAKPPFDVGPMPQIIQYENGIPKVLGKGTHGVSEVLSRIARGEF